MNDVAAATRDGIKRQVLQSLSKTEHLARDPHLARALQDNDLNSLRRISNNFIREALELDVVAFFNMEGRLLTLNTMDQQGNPISQERIDRIFQMNFQERPIIQKCIVNLARRPILEFQTRCDFTPALFDSSGLSVAFSVPVIGPDQSQIGVLSTRLNFQRITSLVGNNQFTRAGNDILLVSDQGKFFSEKINSGEEPAPVPQATMAGFVQQLSSGNAERLFIRQKPYHYTLFSLGIPEILENGHLYVLLRGQDNWVLRERRKISYLFEALLATGLLFIYAVSLLGLRLTKTKQLLKNRNIRLNTLNEQLVDAKRDLERKVEARTRELQEAKSGLEHRVVERTRDLEKTRQTLEEQVRQLELLNRVMIGREERILELKEEIGFLKAKNGKNA